MRCDVLCPAATRDRPWLWLKKQPFPSSRVGVSVSGKPCFELNLNGKVLHDKLFHIMLSHGSDELCHAIVPLDSSATSRMSSVQVQGEHTRAMSPNYLTTAGPMRQVDYLMPVVGYRGECGRCGQLAIDPVACSQCGVYGHVECFQFESFQGFPFCGNCFSDGHHGLRCAVRPGYARTLATTTCS